MKLAHAVQVLLLLLPAAPGCIHRPPIPWPMTPPHVVALERPRSPEILAVLDFVDARPDFERSPRAIDERSVGARWLADDRFFTFHVDDATLARDPAPAPDLRARVTGDAAFAWFPFPHHGVGRPSVGPLGRTFADYLALQIEQRGLFAKVIRAPDGATALAAGATLQLAGRVDRFGAMFAEARDPYVVRPDDWIEYRLLAVAQLHAELSRADDEAPLLRHDCLGRDDDLHLGDRLEGFRGSQVHPLYQLDSEDLPRLAIEDLVSHARRALERATAPLLAEIERVIVPAMPPP